MGMMGLLRAAVLAAAALLAACPELETPLATVAGRIVGASPGAYVYPLGRPDLKVAVAADGTYRLEGVPTSIEAFILFDGAPFSVGRAERVDLELEGGEVNRIADRFGSGATIDEALRMPLAASVLATVSVDGGATVERPSFTVAGTEHEDRAPPSGNQLTIYPVPAGTWDVGASLAGFSPSHVEIQAYAGLTADAALSLEIDLDGPGPGCAALPGCDGGLTCDATDGRCY
ncbi:MAG TPA: hypothetical protein VLT61_03935 [Anaeromyxobacteraceae bacterium]|nr:hypothetical protein [Anaeromyxobacteraceae bacterium]